MSSTAQQFFETHYYMLDDVKADISVPLLLPKRYPGEEINAGIHFGANHSIVRHKNDEAFCHALRDSSCYHKNENVCSLLVVYMLTAKS